MFGELTEANHSLGNPLTDAISGMLENMAEAN